MSTPSFGPGIEITGRVTPEYAQILTPEAVAFAAKLQRAFGNRRAELLARRARRQAELDAGALPDFLPETRAIRDADWTCAPIPADIVDRRVEITGPVDRKMVINALNSGASVFMADFEDANTPKWDNNLQGHLNLRDAIRRRIDYTSPEGKTYRLNEKTAVLFVRPRGWHLPEKHVLIDGQPISGGIFDFALYVFHNAKELLARGSGPYFYLPKLESHLEARLWNDVFVMAQDDLGVPRGSIRATVLIETLLAAFEMDEILYELRDALGGAQLRSLGLHLLVHQEAAEQPGLLPRRPRARHDDDAFHEELRAAPGQDLPPAQHPRDGRHGGADSGEERRGRERGGLRQGEGRQGARGDAGPRRHVGRPSGPRAGRARGVRPADAGAEPDRVEEARRRAHHARPTSSSSSPNPRSPKRACASTSTSRSSTSARGSPARARCRSTT